MEMSVDKLQPLETGLCENIERISARLEPMRLNASSRVASGNKNPGPVYVRELESLSTLADSLKSTIKQMLNSIRP